MGGNFLLLLAIESYLPENLSAPSLTSEQPLIDQEFTAETGTWRKGQSIERRWEVE